MSKQKKRKLKVDPIKLEQLLSEGKTQGEIARELKVSDAAICLARKRLKIDATRAIVHLQRGGEIVKRNMAVMDNLIKANQELNSLLDLLAKASKGEEEAIEQLKAREGFKTGNIQELLIKAAKQVQDGVLAHLEVLKTIFSFSEIEHFMNSVLEVLGECDERIQSEVIKRFESRRLGIRNAPANKVEAEAEGDSPSIR